MEGLVGGGWEPSPQLVAWMKDQGFKGSFRIRIHVEEDRPITFADYSTQNAEAFFGDEDEALYFKITWL
jgi:hypothetical protein